MTALGERERDILIERRLKDTPATLQDLSQRFGISRERVRQIEFRAFGKIKKSVKNTIIEQRLAS
jgi:RNA polymerase sigma-32 factor